MKTDAFETTVVYLVGVPVMAAAFGVVLGVIVLVMGWQSFSERMARRRRGRGLVPQAGVIARGGGGAR